MSNPETAVTADRPIGRPDPEAGSARAALLLAAVAGFVDAIGYLTLDHLFVAHMSGNSAKLGAALGRADLAAAAPVAAAVGLFVLGIALGSALVELDRRHRVGRAPDDHDARRGVLLLAAIWLCYAAGGTTGGFTDRLWHLWSLALPVAALAGLVLAELRRT